MFGLQSAVIEILNGLFLCLQFPRSDAKSHSQTHIESHLYLALRGLETNQHQVHELVTVVNDQSQHIERQSQQIERQSNQIERQSQQIERQSQQIERQLHQIERQSGQIERLMSKDKEQLEKMERSISKVEDQSKQIKQLMSKDKKQSEKTERSISTVQDQPPQREQRGPIKQIVPTPFIWKIPNMIDFYTSAAAALQNLVSKPFYLFERGYKYLLKISRGLLGGLFHLDVSIKVVPGEFDELLSWPCKEKVRVTLDNICGPSLRVPISNVIDFEKGREPCCRPLNDDHQAHRRVLGFCPTQFDSTIFIRVKRE